MDNDTNSLIRDYYDISVVDKMETFENNINKTSSEISEQVNKNKDILNKIDSCFSEINNISDTNKNVSQKIVQVASELSSKMSDMEISNNCRLVNIEELLQKIFIKIDELDKKIDDNNKFCLNITKEINSVKSHVDTQMLNSNMEFNRYVNSAIRSHQPIGFHASRVDKFKSLSASQIL